MAVINIRHRETDHLTRISPFDHLSGQTPSRRSHPLIKSCWAKWVFCFPFPSYSPRESEAACQVVTVVSPVSSRQQSVTVPLTYMVTSPAAPTPRHKPASPREKLSSAPYRRFKWTLFINFLLRCFLIAGLARAGVLQDSDSKWWLVVVNYLNPIYLLHCP